MKLATRFFVSGALLPALVTLAALLVAAEVFRIALENSLDRALLAQAAVESVSLFDGPLGTPHLHMTTSPLEPQVRSFAPVGEVFDSTGKLIVRHPNDAQIPVLTTKLPEPDEPRIDTIRGASAERFHVLSLTVRSPQGQLLLLRLTASLAQVDASVATFRRVTLAFALGLAALLAAVQGLQARRLSRRLARLTEHVSAMQQGLLEHEVPADDAGDEVAVMREALADATERLREARDAEKRLVADAAHELRTPLTLMRTGLDIALRRERSAAELRQAIEETRGEVTRLSLLASHLLDLQVAGRGAWDRSLIDLVPLAEEAVEGVRAESERRKVVVELHGTSPVWALTAEEPMRQALDNLLSNAIRYAPEGSTVTVCVERREKRAFLSVTDAGPGIPEEEREAVFAPFHRVPGTRGGSGLGLSIVREIVLRHGGGARVLEAPGGGTRVELQWPAE